MTTRDFGFDDRYGISVYGLEKNKMVDGDPGARAIQFFLEDKPKNDVPAPIVGTQDDGGGYRNDIRRAPIWGSTSSGGRRRPRRSS